MNKSPTADFQLTPQQIAVISFFLLLLAHFAPGHTVTDGHADP